MPAVPSSPRPLRRALTAALTTTLLALTPTSTATAAAHHPSPFHPGHPAHPAHPAHPLGGPRGAGTAAPGLPDGSAGTWVYGPKDPHPGDFADGPHTRAVRQAGTDAYVDGAESRRAQEERTVLLAATWHLDPALLVATPTDSPATRAAREKLGRLNRHLKHVLAGYDRAQARAEAAGRRADRAQAALDRARDAAQAAQAEYEAAHDALVAIITSTYQTGSLGPLNLMMSAQTGEDLVSGLVVLQQVGVSQADAVQAADKAATRLRDATVAVAAAAQVAHDDLDTARREVARAGRARDRVVVDVTAARSVLLDDLATDAAAAALISGQVSASAAALARGFVATGAKVAFPLPAGTVFVDQHNYGHRSSHWATIHTGDDFSAACGTPVLAATAGHVVIRTDQSWAGQWLVMVSTGDGKLATWYAHMEALAVVDGQKVVAGQPLGLVGAEGNATGCHLHFEVHPTGGSIYEDNTDPGTWLQAAGVYPDGH